jgi:hypothetical protein
MAATMPRVEPAGIVPAKPDQTVQLPLRPAPMKRRLAAGVVDLAILAAVYLVVLTLGLSVGAVAEVGWLGLVWLALVTPLYFALYHAFGTRATPGQLELRIGVRDERTGGLIPLGRALARACGGMLNVSLYSTGPGRPERSLLDRLTRSTSVAIALHGKAPELAAPTAAELAGVFEPAEARNHLSRSRVLLRARPRLLFGSVAAVYAGLLGVVALLAGLLLADLSASSLGLEAAVGWIALGALVLLSGVYWTQAVIVLAVESVRVGRHDVGVAEILRRSIRRVNALSLVILLLAVGVSLVGSSVFLLPILVIVACRTAFVVPALVLEDTRVLGSFARSWQLTRGGLREPFVLLLTSAAILGAAGAVAAGLAAVAVSAASSAETVGAFILAGLAGLALACFPVVYALTLVGTAWSLLYEDLRRRRPPGKR